MLRIPPHLWEGLCGILADAFTRPDLESLVRFNLPHRLDILVDTGMPFDAVVFKLVEKADQRGETEPLLRGAVRARPNRDDLLAFCRAHAAQVFSSPDTGALVRQVEGGLHALDHARHDHRDVEVLLMGAQFQAVFTTVERETAALARYKSLHDGLHNLQMRMVGIESEVAAFAAKPARSPLLAREVINLRGHGRRARETATEALPTQGLELLWIDDLYQAADEIAAALAALDPAGMTRALAGLRRLLQEAYRIDSLMAATAARLSLGELITALTAVHGQLAPVGAAPSPTAAEVLAGRDALSLLRPRLNSRVSEHGEWQWLTKELAGVESNPGHRPADKVPRWGKVRERLQGLCKSFEADAWAAELLGCVKRWESEAAAGRVAEAEEAAVAVQAAAMSRFFDVDLDLLNLCGQLTRIGEPLNDLLKGGRG